MKQIVTREMLSMLKHVFVLTVLNYSYAQRRIIHGINIGSNKGYMVYLVPAEESPRNYDSWICGGVIVHPLYVLTSAACLEDVEKVYVIAGYKRYVKLTDLDKDLCTKNMKRRVIVTNTPIAYEMDYNKTEKWAKLDIALAEVDNAYQFNDDNFIKYCSYLPRKIDINYDKNNEKAGTQVIVLGWGHRRKWRMHGSNIDHNVNALRYGATMIYMKNECKTYFTDPDLSTIIDNYMICTYGRGLLNDTGHTNLEHEYEPEVDPMKFEYPDFDMDYDTYTNKFLKKNREGTKPKQVPGLCQNDHGGPLIAWVNQTEMVLGVASVFRVDQDSNCMPPFLFTSTFRNIHLLDCLVNESPQRRCTEINNTRNYKVITRRISWNEQSSYNPTSKEAVIMKRPQISLSLFQG